MHMRAGTVRREQYGPNVDVRRRHRRSTKKQKKKHGHQTRAATAWTTNIFMSALALRRLDVVYALRNQNSTLFLCLCFFSFALLGFGSAIVLPHVALSFACQRFYLIGSNKLKTAYRVLKIHRNRGDVTTLDIDEVTIVFPFC